MKFSGTAFLEIIMSATGVAHLEVEVVLPAPVSVMPRVAC